MRGELKGFGEQLGVDRIRTAPSGGHLLKSPGANFDDDSRSSQSRKAVASALWQFDLRSQYLLMWNEFEGLCVMQFRRQLLDVCGFQHSAAGGTSTS